MASKEIILNLRLDQCDLMLESLRHWKQSISDGIASEAHRAAARYTNRRIAELIAQIEAKTVPEPMK